MSESVSESMPEPYTLNLRINNVSEFRDEFREYKMKLGNKEVVERNQTFETIQDIMNNTDMTMNDIEQYDECSIFVDGKVRGYSYNSESVDTVSMGI